MPKMAKLLDLFWLGAYVIWHALPNYQKILYLFRFWAYASGALCPLWLKFCICFDWEHLTRSNKPFYFHYYRVTTPTPDGISGGLFYQAGCRVHGTSITLPGVDETADLFTGTTTTSNGGPRENNTAHRRRQQNAVTANHLRSQSVSPSPLSSPVPPLGPAPPYDHSNCSDRMHKSCACVSFIAEHTKAREEATKVKPSDVIVWHWIRQKEPFQTHSLHCIWRGGGLPWMLTRRGWKGHRGILIKSVITLVAWRLAPTSSSWDLARQTAAFKISNPCHQAVKAEWMSSQICGNDMK